MTKKSDEEFDFSSSLFILKFLTEQTDEKHLATITNINEYLRQYDLDANRETISDCIKELQDVGYDIGICLRSYFVQQRHDCRRKGCKTKKP